MSRTSNISPVLLLSLLFVAVSSLYKGDPCETREGSKGVCMLIDECPSAQAELRAMRHRPTNCGFEGRNPIVCCADDPRVNEAKRCKTWEGSEGVCMPIVECPSAKRELSTMRYPTNCGSQGRILTVCCAGDPNGTTTTPSPEPETVITPAVTAAERGNSDGPREKFGREKDSIDGERSKRKPGEAATYWCAQYAEKCKSQNYMLQRVTQPIRRFKREVEGGNYADYEDFGTSENPPIQTWYDDDQERQLYYIHGGRNVYKDEFSHMAAVGFGKQNNIRWECGGSLISDKFVLTAAHCLIAQDGRRAEWILLGSNDVSDKLRGYSASSNGIIYHIIRRIRHPGYRLNSKYNDIALLELGPSLEYNKEYSHGVIQPACLQVEWDSKMRMATASGWGRLGYGEDPSSSLLQVELPILDNSICNETYSVEIRLSKISNGIDESMICAGDLRGGKDTCQGDSGGPLQYRTDSCLWHVMGVTSFGKFCGFANTPSVYMRVSHFIPWIENIVWPEKND